jgi:tRNA U34 5-methylaminomethyl-2-thiouridine-forming methyltransferase MnmC
VLDYCFGLGYNTAAALDLFLDSNNTFIEITAIENDKEILNKISTIKQDFNSFDIIKKLVKENEIGINVNEKVIKAELVIGDCLKEVPKLEEESFNVVFFDPFSAKKCPELWTEQAFKQVFNVMKKGAILTTYSCSKEVRNNMRKAGFIVKEGPDIDHGHPGTVGIKN